MRYEVVLFDLDGTLTDPEEGITKSIQQALSAFGVEENDSDRLRSFIGPPLKDTFQSFYGLNDEEARRAIALYRKRFSETGLYENIVYEGVERLLARLKTRHTRVALATSKPTVYAERILAHFGLEGYFDRIVGSELNGERSAKAEVIDEALARLGNPNVATSVMVGDRIHDVVGAQVCNIDSIGVLYGYGSREELLNSGATHIVETVDELEVLLCE